MKNQRLMVAAENSARKSIAYSVDAKWIEIDDHHFKISFVVIESLIHFYWHNYQLANAIDLLRCIIIN